MRRTVTLVLLAAALVLVVGLWRYQTRDYRPVFSRVAGTLIQVRDSTGIGRAQDGKQLTEVTLISDTGLEVRLRVRALGERTGIRYPAALLVGDIKTGRKTADVPRKTENLILASIDYPYDGPQWPRGWQWVRYFVPLRRGFLDTPPALLLAAQYLYTRGDVDPERVSIIGVSLGVPFATATAATDRRLSGAALLHGGADIRRMAYYAYADGGPAWVMNGLAIATALVVAPLEPAKYAGEIAPRPTLVVNTTDDTRIDPQAGDRLQRAVRQPKQVVWHEAGHVRRSETEIVAELMQMTLDWMAANGLR
ncbi:MAG: prolyl oligopeptidase family serine peptidase [Gemmatimonadetes bacterium]|nr:prolyl oligopeptidase family serine peptidase [Gemmatimonadota bacterium]